MTNDFEVNLKHLVEFGKGRFKKYPYTEYGNELRIDDEVYALFGYVTQMRLLTDEMIDTIVSMAEHMNDNLNQFNLTLETFLSRFDGKLRDTLINILSEWQKSGALDDLIDESLQTEMDILEEETHEKLNDFAEQLNQKAQQTSVLSLQGQIDSLVVNNAAPENAEIVQARIDGQGNGFSTLKGVTDNLFRILDTGKILISFSDWVHGAVEGNGFENTLNTFIRTSGFHSLRNIPITIEPSGDYKLRIVSYTTEGVFISTSTFYDKKYIFYPQENKKYKFVIGYNQAGEISTSAHYNIKMTTPFNTKAKPSGIEGMRVSNNVINPKDIEEKTVINAETGEPEPSNAYMSTGFIPYYLGQKLFSKPYRNYVVYDGDKNRIGANATETFENSEIIWENRPETALIRFSYRTNNIEDMMVSHHPISHYEPYGVTMPNLIVNSENLSTELLGNLGEATGNKLTGKTLYSFGTSLHAGHYSGEGMVDGLAKENGMIYTKYAKNGAQTVGTTSIYKQIADASPVIPNFITMDGIANDAYNEVVDSQLGTISEDYSGVYDTTTYCGSLENIFYTLRNKYSTAKIIYVFAHKMPTRTVYAQEELYKVTKEICKKWSITPVDIYNEGQINTHIDVMRNDYSYNQLGETSGGNGTHLTGSAYDEWYKPHIEAAMLSLI